MERIKDYQIVEGSSPGSLSAKIKDLLDAGWQPYAGPVSGVNANGNRVLLQAMVKCGATGRRRIVPAARTDEFRTI